MALSSRPSATPPRSRRSPSRWSRSASRRRKPASANSLWRTGARAFFNDQRAGRVGDILTVQIDIDDSAKTNNASNSSRTSGSTLGVPHFFGLREHAWGKSCRANFDASRR